MAIFEPIQSSLDDTDMRAELFHHTMGISRIISKILVNRGIHDMEEAHAFLNPSIEQLFDPFELHDMDKAVKRINQAISSKEHITIYGDYDVDGMTSCAVLFNFFTNMGCRVDVYIPNRHREGYGINCEAIEAIHKRGTRLMISVDCGITSISEVEFAKKLGIDIIITDHHQCGPSLPEAIAVINPARDPRLHNTHPLAGVGVAGKLVQAIAGSSCLKQYLDLIALGTVADVVPLIGDNRIFVAKGLEKINQLPCAGIEALVMVSGMKDIKVNTGRIAFGLAPRLNAAGRIDDPLKGFQLLAAKKLSHAVPIADFLEEQNRYRQAMEAHIIGEAEEMIKDNVNLSTDRIIVLGKEGWNPGVIGIAASKIAEKYYRPCILISIEEDLGVGSARSIKGFSIYDALDSCSHLLKKFGGHEQAAGFSLAKEDIRNLRDALINYCGRTIHDYMLIPRYTYDTILKSGDITYDLAKELEALEPFGIGNPSPTFLLSNARLEESRKVGSDGKHLKMSIGLGQRLWDGIAFGMGERAESLWAANRLSIVTGLEKNEWRGISKLQFNVKHMDIILENSEDWDEFLAFFHLKFFDAFFSDFMYNKHYNEDIYSLQSKSLPQVDMDEIIREFERTRIGNLVLINSLFNSQSIVRDILDNNLTERVVSSYGQSNNWDGIGVNRCIFAPNYSNISFSDYSNVYIFEDELPFYSIDSRLISNEKVYRVVSKEGRAMMSTELSREYIVERDDFAFIYRWLRSLSTGQNIWQGWLNLIEDYQTRIGREVNGFKVRLMLRIFEDLNFIKVESSNRFVKVKCVIKPTPRKLEESLLFCYYNKWLSKLSKKW